MEKSKLGPQTLLYPMPAVLVGAMVGEKPNFMTAAWCGIAASKPPAISVALQKIRHTLKGIKEHDTFSINVPSTTIAEQVDYCGIYSGKKRDKSELFNVFFGVLETAPLIQECPVNLECQVIHTLDLKSHELLIGEILEEPGQSQPRTVHRDLRDLPLHVLPARNNAERQSIRSLVQQILNGNCVHCLPPATYCRPGCLW